MWFLQSILELILGKVDSLLLLAPADLTSHSEKSVALIHKKIIHLEGSPNCSAIVSDSVLGPFEGRASRLLSSHVVANHVIGCGSRVVFLHVGEGFPSVFISVPAHFELHLT